MRNESEVDMRIMFKKLDPVFVSIVFVILYLFSTLLVVIMVFMSPESGRRSFAVDISVFLFALASLSATSLNLRLRIKDDDEDDQIKFKRAVRNCSWASVLIIIIGIVLFMYGSYEKLYG